MTLAPCRQTRMEVNNSSSTQVGSLNDLRRSSEDPQPSTEESRSGAEEPAPEPRRSMGDQLKRKRGLLLHPSAEYHQLPSPIPAVPAELDASLLESHQPTELLGQNFDIIWDMANTSQQLWDSLQLQEAYSSSSAASDCGSADNFFSGTPSVSSGKPIGAAAAEEPGPEDALYHILTFPSTVDKPYNRDSEQDEDYPTSSSRQKALLRNLSSCLPPGSTPEASTGLSGWHHGQSGSDDGWRHQQQQALNEERNRIHHHPQRVAQPPWKSVIQSQFAAYDCEPTPLERHSDPFIPPSASLVCSAETDQRRRIETSEAYSVETRRLEPYVNCSRKPVTDQNDAELSGWPEFEDFQKINAFPKRGWEIPSSHSRGGRSNWQARLGQIVEEATKVLYEPTVDMGEIKNGGRNQLIEDVKQVDLSACCTEICVNQSGIRIESGANYMDQSESRTKNEVFGMDQLGSWTENCVNCAHQSGRRMENHFYGNETPYLESTLGRSKSNIVV